VSSNERGFVRLHFHTMGVQMLVNVFLWRLAERFA